MNLKKKSCLLIFCFIKWKCSTPRNTSSPFTHLLPSTFPLQINTNESIVQAHVFLKVGASYKIYAITSNPYNPYGWINVFWSETIGKKNYNVLIVDYRFRLTVSCFWNKGFRVSDIRLCDVCIFIYSVSAWKKRVISTTTWNKSIFPSIYICFNCFSFTWNMKNVRLLFHNSRIRPLIL